MWLAVRTLATANWKLIAVALVVIAIFFAGRMSSQLGAVKHEVKTMEKANAIQNKINGLPDADVDERLRKWQR